MLFTYYSDDLRSVPFVCVDGVVEGGLNLSHWPGNRTPAHLKADTSTEMALRLARDPARGDWLRDVRVVTNNHFDTDGLLSVYAVLRPGEALRHERALVQAARAGDFGEFISPDAFKFDAVVSAFDDDRESPLADRIRGLPEHARYQILYEHLLDRMPALLEETAEYKSLWSVPLKEVMRSLMRIRDVARLREHDDARLTVIETAEELHETARFNVARYHRVLTATRSPGGLIYSMDFLIFSWFDTVTPPRGTRLDLTPLATELDSMEPMSGGRWIYTGNDSLAARLYHAAPDGTALPSSLPLETLEARLLEIFRHRP